MLTSSISWLLWLEIGYNWQISRTFSWLSSSVMNLLLYFINELKMTNLNILFCFSHDTFDMDIVAIHRTRHNEPRNGLFLWLTGRLRKPPLKWHRRLKNSHNTTVQLQTLIGSRDNRIRYLVKFNNLKQCMCTRFATAFNCARHTISVVFFTIPVSMSLLRSKRLK